MRFKPGQRSKIASKLRIERMPLSIRASVIQHGAGALRIVGRIRFVKSRRFRGNSETARLSTTCPSVEWSD